MSIARRTRQPILGESGASPHFGLELAGFSFYDRPAALQGSVPSAPPSPGCAPQLVVTVMP